MVLLTNDDGVAAPGLLVLAKAFYGAGVEIAVTAPDRERSAVGHGMTFSHGLTVQEYVGAYPPIQRIYSCSGTPTDCVILGLDELVPEASWVISGVNRGPNLGDDLTYSGTVAAAMEGLLSNRRAIAVSLCTSADERAPHYDTAAALALKIYRWAQEQNLPPEILLNLNVPDCPMDELRGIKVVRKGIRRYAGRVRRETDSSGNSLYWLGGQISDLLEPHTDVWAVAHGYGAVTPVHMDMTHFPSLSALAGLEDL